MKLLFTAGTARGGTNFRTLMLNNHSTIRMSLDPFIPLFRFYRDSLLKSVGQEHLLEEIPSVNALDDYYFSVTKMKIMKAIQNADPDIPFDMSCWSELKKSIASRMKLASVNLIPHLDKLPAPTFRETFNNTMQVIAATSDKSNLEWVGFNDNWTMEFFPLIAKLIPDAKFMLHLRDPRAVINSSEFAEPDPAKHPPVITFARHLRKYYAFSRFLSEAPILQNRLLITNYEPCMVDTDKELKRMTDFLGVNFEPSMTEIEKFRKADGTSWPSKRDVYKASTDIWREEMPREMAELTEFICDPEMRLCGYIPEIYDPELGLSPEAIEFTLRNSRESLGWTTDYPEIERMLGSEFFRKQVLKVKERPSRDEIERCFLFEDVYNELKQL